MPHKYLSEDIKPPTQSLHSSSSVDLASNFIGKIRKHQRRHHLFLSSRLFMVFPPSCLLPEHRNFPSCWRQIPPPASWFLPTATYWGRWNRNYPPSYVALLYLSLFLGFSLSIFTRVHVSSCLKTSVVSSPLSSSSIHFPFTAKHLELWLLFMAGFHSQASSESAPAKVEDDLFLNSWDTP